MQPSYTLLLEHKNETNFPVMFAKKRLFNSHPNFAISLRKTVKSRKDEECIGKLKGNCVSLSYKLYNNGENPKKIHKVPISKIRNELLAVQFKYVKTNELGKLRKAQIVIPAINQEYKKPHVWKPYRKEDSMIKKINNNLYRHKLYEFADNLPIWDPIKEE